MNTQKLIGGWLGRLAILVGMVASPAWGQGTLPQTLSWSGTTDKFLALNQTYPLRATSSSGLPVTLRVETGPAVVGNGMITVTNLGTIWVIAEQAGDATYASTQLARSFNVREITFSRQVGYNSGGLVRSVQVVGSNAYLANQLGDLELLDLSQPNQPLRLGRVAANGAAYGVEVVGNHAYVAHSFSGLQIINVSDPANPVQIGLYQPIVEAYAVHVVDNKAYVADRFAGLKIIDVHDPANPVLLGTYILSGETLDVQVVGNFAYLANLGAGLQIIDISNPANPVRVGGYDTTGQASGVQVVENLAYVADGTAGVQVLEVSQPANPVRVGGYDTSGTALGVQVVGQYAYVADGLGGVQAIDVSRPASPLKVGGSPTEDTAYGVQVVGNRMYVAASNGGLKVFELALGTPQSLTWTGTTNESLTLNVPYPLRAVTSSGLPVTVRVAAGQAFITNGMLTVTAPGTVVVTADQAGDATYIPVHANRRFNLRQVQLTPVGRLNTFGFTYSVTVAGNYAYTTEGNAGLQIIDVHDPTNPVRVGEYPTSNATVGVDVVGHLAYVSDSLSGLQIVDVSNPAIPVRVGGYDTTGETYGVSVVGNYAYLADGPVGLQVIDIRDPANPVRVGGIDISGSARAIRVVGSQAYVAAGGSGLLIIDVSNPAHPIITGRYNSGGFAVAVQVVNEIAYLTCEVRNGADGGLRVVDVSHPRLPQLVGENRIAGSFEGVDVAANLAWVVKPLEALQVIDVADPAQPTPVGGSNFNLNARGVQVTGDLVYVAAGGLSIYRWGFRPVDSIDFVPPAQIVVTNGFIPLMRLSGNSRTIQYSVVSGPGRVEGDRLTLTGAGMLILRGELPDDGVYEALSRQWSIEIQRASQSLAWIGTTRDVLELNTAYPLSATSSSALPVTLRVETGPAILADGTITATEPGTIVVSTDQVGDANYAPARLLRSFNVQHLQLTPVGSFVSNQSAVGLHVVGSLAFVAYGTGGLHVFDVGHPARPVRLAGVPIVARSVQVVGPYAYVAAEDSGLLLLDISNPSQPILVGQYNTAGSAFDVQVAGSYAYVADNSGGLVVIDVGDPMNLVRAGGIATTGQFLGVDLAGQYAYVADWVGLQVIDISNPADPVRVGGLASSSADALQVVGNLAYVANGGLGLQVLDVGNPAAPVRVGGQDTPGFARDVHVVGNRAFVADAAGGVRVFDVSLPAQPLPVGAFSTPGSALGVQVVGNHAYVADAYAGLQVFELRSGYPQTLTWQGTTDEYLDWNVPYPLSATASSGLPVTLRVESGPAVIVDGKLTVTGSGSIWVTAEQAGNEAYLPAQMTRGHNVRQAALGLAGQYKTVDSAQDLQIVGTYAYIAIGPVGLQVIDVSHPTNPVRVGGYDTSGYSLGVHVAGQYAYLADGTAGLQVIDVSNPTQPTRVGGCDCLVDARAVTVAANNAYVVDTNHGLLAIFNVSDPTNPLLRVKYYTDSDPRDVQVVGPYAYVANGARGLLVLDVSNPAQPVPVGAYDTLDSADQVQVVGNHAYVADRSAGLLVLDITNPTQPLPVGSYQVSNVLEHLHVAGNYAYLANGNDGLHVLDVSNPTKPVRVGGITTQGTFDTVQNLGNYTYVIDRFAGLQIYTVNLRSPQALRLQIPIEVPFQTLPLFPVATSSSGFGPTVSVVSGPATVANNQLTLTGLGPISLRGEQAGNADFLPVSTEWTITVVPPHLAARLIPAGVEVSWPAGIPELQLQIRESLSPDSPWQNVATPVQVSDGTASVIVDGAPSQRFLRLRKP